MNWWQIAGWALVYVAAIVVIAAFAVALCVAAATADRESQQAARHGR